MFLISIEDVCEHHRHLVGGKGYALSRLKKKGLNVPKAVCLTTEAYRTFIGDSGLDKKILIEIHRKRLDSARWEEMWDTALRIRNLFVRTNIPNDLENALREGLDQHFAETAAAVRSSALGEDSAQVFFAGIHDSFINISGADAILKHIKLVWSSLWSDAAILYRKQLKLDLEKSAMAVVVQELVPGDYSGVFFGKNPMDGTQSVIEAVYGLNQGLVDGTIEPDQWILSRTDGKVLSHTPAVRKKVILPFKNSVHLADIDPQKSQVAPLSLKRVQAVFNLGIKAEKVFGLPQDVEWTYRGHKLYTLQSRPITTDQGDQKKDKKSWYLTLRRSFENLIELQNRIEKHTLPEMIREFETMARQDLSRFQDEELSHEIQRRLNIYKHWVGVYWKEFIPFAHGFRLFGQVYNDKIHPGNPYEFVELLRPRSMHSLERNRILDKMAAIIQHEPKVKQDISIGRLMNVKHPKFQTLLKNFLDNYANLKIYEEMDSLSLKPLSGFLLEIAKSSASKQKTKKKTAETPPSSKYFFSKFPEEEQGYARQLLDLAKFSYRLRDDDNIYLGRIERQKNRAVLEGRKRLKLRLPSIYLNISEKEIIKSLRFPEYRPVPVLRENIQITKPAWQARQLKGQPAGKGLATGDARVVSKESDLFDFKKGEILVCEAVDPNMTFVVPLAAGIVEKRGGMLIHGAIIAREYGIPCVTGVINATQLVQTGDSVTVDGFLGLVIIEHGKIG